MTCAERELVLLKIRAPPGPTRTEVMQLIDIFRARVVDVSDRSLTIAVTGDAGKVGWHPGDFFGVRTWVREMMKGVF